VAHREALVAILAPLFAAAPASHWLAQCKARNVPAGPINRLDAVFDDAQIRARGMVVEMQHAENPALKLAANPLKLSRTPVRYERPPPLLGEHNREILGDGD
jgi:crotonobetainyl-CoA:carnitine CoA-transferase CaiB-like acyl-CoA transferase